MTRINPVLQHLEGCLGAMAEGWRDPAEPDGGLCVVRFPGEPWEGVSTFASIGLSDRPLRSSNGRMFRQELLMGARDRFAASEVASTLLTFAQHLGANGRALLRGEVVGPAAPIVPGSPLNSLYASLPAVYDDRLWTLDTTEPTTVFVWLIPLQEREAAFVRCEGWEAFEDMLEKADPDLFDLRRPEVLHR